MSNQVHNRITDSAKKREKQFAVLIDPDKIDGKSLGRIIDLAVDSHVDYFFVGGSLMVNNFLDECLQIISESCDIPTVLFPGSPAQVSPFADAILLLSLVSGRNPNLLIGEQVLAAPAIKRSGLEVISTGYMLVDGGKPTTVSYISNTTPIPQDKPDIAVCTAMAAEMLGFKTIYLDTGSGAKHSVSSEMINAAKSNISCLLYTSDAADDQ